MDEHKDYFSSGQLQEDVGFLIDVLGLKKEDDVLDLCCGHGRHSIELRKRGYRVDGLDFSGHLLKLAGKNAEEEGLQVNFYQQDVHSMKLEKKYDKIFMFFSEFGLFDAEKVLENVGKTLRAGGLFLLDCDNVFRLVQYLKDNHEAPFDFDFVNMRLKEKGDEGADVRYYIVPELRELFVKHGLEIVSIYGDYMKSSLSLNSKRIVMVGKKMVY